MTPVTSKCSLERAGKTKRTYVRGLSAARQFLGKPVLALRPRGSQQLAMELQERHHDIVSN